MNAARKEARKQEHKIADAERRLDGNKKLLRVLREIGSAFDDACMEMAQWDEDKRSADDLHSDLDTAGDFFGDRICWAFSDMRLDSLDKDLWNEVVDIFTSQIIRHIPGLNERLKH